MASLVGFLQNDGFITQPLAEEVSASFYSRDIEKNEFLLREGQVCNEYLFLEQGYIRSFAHDVEGNDITTGFYGPGSVVFDVASFFMRIPSQENIQALSDCSGYYIDFNGLNKLFHDLPQFREFGRGVLVKGYASLKQRTLNMITTTAEARYLAMLQTNPDIFNHAPLKHIATYLGITDTSLSRIRREFANK